MRRSAEFECYLRWRLRSLRYWKRSEHPGSVHANGFSCDITSTANVMSSALNRKSLQGVSLLQLPSSSKTSAAMLAGERVSGGSANLRSADEPPLAVIPQHALERHVLLRRSERLQQSRTSRPDLSRLTDKINNSKKIMTITGWVRYTKYQLPWD